MNQHSERVSIRGKLNSSTAEMSTDERKVYEKLDSQFVDQDGNGVPDRFENGGKGAFELEGVTNPAYHSREEIEAVTSRAFRTQSNKEKQYLGRSRTSRTTPNFLNRGLSNLVRLTKWLLFLGILFGATYIGLVLWEGV